MKHFLNVKRICALVLALCFFMPLSQCTSNPNSPKDTNSEKQIVLHYAYKQDSVEMLIFSILAFFWPIAYLIVAAKKNSIQAKSLFRKLMSKFVEMIFCFLSAYVLFLNMLFAEPLVASYFAALSIIFYFVATLLESIFLIRIRHSSSTL